MATPYEYCSAQEEATGWCRHQLIKKATENARDRLVKQGQDTSYKYLEQAIDFLTQAWELREAAFGQHHAETAIAYERLAAAHARAGRHADKSDNSTKIDHFTQAVRFFNSARNIFEEFEGVGPGSAACARVSRALREAYKVTHDYERAGQQAVLVAFSFEREANRGRRHLEGSTEPEVDLPILIPLKSGSSGGTLALRSDVGVQASAEQARNFFKLSVRDFTRALRESDDDEVGIRIGMECMKSAKASVALSAQYFGSVSECVADDLLQLGALCSE